MNPHSIRKRLMRLVMTTSLVALLISATALLIYELQARRASWLASFEKSAAVLGESVVLLWERRQEVAERMGLARDRAA